MAEMWTVIQSPIGDLRIVERDDAISAIEFSPFREPRADGPIGESSVHHPVLVEAARQLAAYFAQELTEFDLPLDPHGTDFQKRVWNELLEIKHGATASYGEIARRLGHTNAASRAVGLDTGRKIGRPEVRDRVWQYV